MEGDQQGYIQEFPELLDFIGLKKKKKVKFQTDERNLFDGSRSNIINDVKNSPSDAIIPLKEPSESETDLSFSFMKKKKKNKSKKEGLDDDALEIGTDKVDTLTLLMNANDSDYSYEDLLTRIFSIMRKKDPNRDVGNKKLIMKPPQIIRIGSKKSSFVNFLEMCRLLHRVPQHVQSFLLVELGTSGSLDGNNQLIIKGRFEQKQIENVLRSYIKEYVSCHTCRSPDTVLQKDTRLFFLQCESCGARCSVASVKAGFQAVTSKRAAIRAKAS